MFKKQELIKYLRDNFRLDWDGPHGVSHWARVKNNGMKLCDKYPDADRLVVELFAWLHDMERVNDAHDPEHGPRSARVIITDLYEKYFILTDQQAEDLIIAIRDHSKGLTEGNITVRVCWDSDRLDLGRFGTLPDPKLLCTELGRDLKMIEWAHNNAVKAEYHFSDSTTLRY